MDRDKLIELCKQHYNCDKCGFVEYCEKDCKTLDGIKGLADHLIANGIGDITAEKHRADVAEDCIRLVIGVLRYEFAGKTMIKMACEKTIESYGSIAKVIEKTDLEENDLIEYFTERLKERNNDRD